MDIVHNLSKYNFAGGTNDVTFAVSVPAAIAYSRVSFQLPTGYQGIAGQGFTLHLAGQSFGFVYTDTPQLLTDLPIGTDLLDALLAHSVVSLHCTGQATGDNRFELRSTTVSDFAVTHIQCPLCVETSNYVPSAHKSATVHCIVQNAVLPSELSLAQGRVRMGLSELLCCEPPVPNPQVTIQQQSPVELQIRYGEKGQRLQATEPMYFVAGTGQNRDLNPVHPLVYCHALHDYGANPVYVHHRQPNWMYLFCTKNIGSNFPFDSRNAVIQFRCLFSDGTMYSVVVDEEMNFSMTQGNVYVFACGLEQMMSLDVIRQNTPQGAVIEKYAFELVSLNRLITYFEQWFFVDQRFLHPLDQTTFICYDNGKGGFQTAFFSGTVQRTPKIDKSDIRNHRGQPAAIIHESTQTMDISTGYWDDDNQLKRYLRILSSPKVYIVHWQVATADKVELEPVGVKTGSVALPTDWQASNAFTVQVERLM